jgi:hypothetical protein
MATERTQQIPQSTRAAALRLLATINESGLWAARRDVRNAARALDAELEADQRQFGPAIDVTDPSYQKAHT